MQLLPASTSPVPGHPLGTCPPVCVGAQGWDLPHGASCHPSCPVLTQGSD